jgi:hypothetical protein
VPSCSQWKLKKRDDTSLCNLNLLSPHEQLQSDPYPSVLYKTGTIKRSSSDRKKVRTFGNIYCYVFMCILSDGLLNRQNTESLRLDTDSWSH